MPLGYRRMLIGLDRLTDIELFLWEELFSSFLADGDGRRKRGSGGISEAAAAEASVLLGVKFESLPISRGGL